MRRNFFVVCVGLALAVVLAGCSSEIKPDRPGAFVVTGETLVEMSPVAMQEEYTPEMFVSSYFTGEPTVTFRFQKSHFIFNGDYRPLAIRQVVNEGGRWVEDSAHPVDRDVFQVGPMKGEKQMLKGKILKELKNGVYVLDLQRESGRQDHFAFRIP